MTYIWKSMGMMALVACAVAACGGAGEVQVGKEGDNVSTRAGARQNTEGKVFERVPQSTKEWLTGEAPDALVDAIVSDLVQRTGGVKSDITVLRAEAVTWPDGSMGCPQPGQVYTQATVDGYWVVLGYHGREYDYRAAASGYFFLCEPRRSRRPGDPGTGPIEQPPKK